MMFQAIFKNVRTSQEVGIRLKGRSQLWDHADLDTTFVHFFSKLNSSYDIVLSYLVKTVFKGIRGKEERNA